MSFGYRRRPTNRTFPAGMNYLSDLIIRPGIEKTFGPLLLYRGHMNRGAAHRKWNMALLMMATECETLSDGLKVLNNPSFSQLCGPVRPPPKISLYTFFQRLGDNPAVTRNIQGLTDYVKSLELGPCGLQRVDRFSARAQCAPWRISLHLDAGKEAEERGIPASQQLFYPFMAHDAAKPDDGAALVKLVNAAVPQYWPEHIRADACQDLIVALLSGEIGPGEVHDHAQEYVGRVYQMHPSKFDHGNRAISFNQPILGTEDLSWTERV